MAVSLNVTVIAFPAPTAPVQLMPQSLDFLLGGGRMGGLMRAHDWSSSPLGPPGVWPQSLRTVVALLLQSQFPMFVAWGDALGFLYNDSYAEILGTKHPRALGGRFSDIWSEIWPDISPLIDAAMAGQATYREDLPLVMNRKGYDEETWFTFSYSPVRDESGKVAGMFCAVSETTRKVLAERALRQSEARLLALNETLERRVTEALAERKLLADIVEGTNAFVQVADLEYRWLAINRAATDEFERIFGIRPRVGDPCWRCWQTSRSTRQRCKAVWSRALAGEEFTAIEEFGDPGRERRAYEMRYNTLRDRDGRRIGAYQFVYDVTERLRDQERLRQAEEALRQAQKMESLGQLTGGVAHDFNNLLAVFATGLQLLERSITPQQKERIFEGMRRAVARGTGLTRQLLAFSRRRPLNPESLNLSTHLSGMREMLERSLGGDIHVEMQFAPEVWPVEVDAGEMELAVLNLCVNARDAMSKGGVDHHLRRQRAGAGRHGRHPRPRQAVDCRPGHRHAAGSHGACLRAFLHDEGRQQGIGPRPHTGVWVCAAVRRTSLDPQPGRHGNDGHRAASPFVATAGPGHSPRGGSGGHRDPDRRRDTPWPSAAGRRRPGGLCAHA